MKRRSSKNVLAMHAPAARAKAKATRARHRAEQAAFDRSVYESGQKLSAALTPERIEDELRSLSDPASLTLTFTLRSGREVKLELHEAEQIWSELTKLFGSNTR